ncbi:cache domain-containing protein [Rhodoferax saidenbachensis]|nr:cache domain-containing protein [Rhodoferax saidenbachensis]
MRINSMFKGICAAFVASLMMVGASHAAEQGTAAEAEAMVKKAVAYIKANGPEKAYEEFTNGKSFKDRDLYIFAYDFTGKNLAHGANPKLVGKDLIGLKDPDGKLILPPLIEVAKSKGKGWSDTFKFRNPMTEKMEDKVIYFERVGDTFVGCGIYKK